MAYSELSAPALHKTSRRFTAELRRLSRHHSSARGIMRKAYGYSRRLKSKPSALFPGGARLCYLMGALFYLSCPAIHCATARSNAAPLFWRFNSRNSSRLRCAPYGCLRFLTPLLVVRYGRSCPCSDISQRPFRQASSLRLTTLLTVEHVYIPLPVRLVHKIAACPEIGVWEFDLLLAETSGAPIQKRKEA